MTDEYTNNLEVNLKNSPDVAKGIDEFLKDPSTGVVWDPKTRTRKMNEENTVNLDEDEDDDGPFNFDNDEDDDDDDEDEDEN